MPDLPIIAFKSEAAWEQWLETNHVTSPGLWLKIAKKDTGVESEESIMKRSMSPSALAGSTDKKNKFDDQHWLQKFTPRRAKSLSGHANHEKVAPLIEQGKMREAGMKEIERA